MVFPTTTLVQYIFIVCSIFVTFGRLMRDGYFIKAHYRYLKESYFEMKNFIQTFLILCALKATAQSAKIEVPETYELSNIILALTNYGISDEWEVQKKTAYYKELLDYFDPVKNHPLLDSVNYSREKWEDYLSFRTDAVAFIFHKDGTVKRAFEFYTNKGHDPFDKNLVLINDFILKSNFRKFYREHQHFYNRMISNYENYNYIKETISFLDKRIGKQNESKGVYKIMLSPLVYRMNCHRNLAEKIVADFPSATEAFINGVNGDETIEDRLNSNHLIFTEKDHEYINPITDKHVGLVRTNFDTKYWDNNSGYADSNSFNEYMTWAVYDLFLEEYFPAHAAKLKISWQYQNASRGFFAQNLFSNKVKELYLKNRGQKFENIYEPLLKWIKEVEKKVTLPTLINVDGNKFVKADLNQFTIEFSEEMDTKQPFGYEIREFKNSNATGNKKFITQTDFVWSNNNKTLNFKVETEYEEFALVFNWWGIEKPLISKNGIFLKPSSYVLLKK